MKVLFIGLGGIGQRHMRRLLEIRPEVQIAAVRTRRNLFEITDQLGIDPQVDIEKKYHLKVFPDLGEAIQEWRPDAAVVANPTILHVPTTLQLVRAGVPVLLEKPISSDLEGAFALLHEVQRAGGRVAVGYMMRYHPAVRRLHELVRARSIGPILSADVAINSYLPDWHPYESYKALYAARRDLGGGVILTEMHEIDLLCWFFGKPDKVWACGGTLALDLDVEDTVGAAIRFTMDGRSLPVTLSLSFARQPVSRQFVVHGQRGCLRLDLMRSELEMDGVNGKQVETYAHISRDDLFRWQMEAFIDGVEKRGRLPVALEEVMEGHIAALAMKDALQKDALVTPRLARE